MAMSTSLGDCPVRNFDLGSHGGDTPWQQPGGPSGCPAGRGRRDDHPVTDPLLERLALLRSGLTPNLALQRRDLMASFMYARFPRGPARLLGTDVSGADGGPSTRCRQ